jgi:predicted dehydrogenase
MPLLSRRDFLQQSSALALGPVFSDLISPDIEIPLYTKPLPVSDKIRIGLIGSGGMGRGDLATFLNFPDVDCPIICDVDEDMAGQGATLVYNLRDKKMPEVVKDFRRVIDRKDLDAVLVATPDHWHALPTIYACMSGKDVYVEKPLATSIDEGRAMLEAAKQANRVVQMGTQWRSGKHWKDAVEFVQSGKLGKVGLVRGWAYHDWLGGIGNPPDADPPKSVDYDLWLGPAPKRPFNPNRFHFNFRWFWDYAGGLMTDWGVHLINIMLWAMGPAYPKSVSSTGGKFVLDDNTQTPDTQVTVYEFPTYTLVWEHKVGVGLGLNGRPWGIAFTGSEGTLIINDDGWEIIPEPKKKSLQPQKFPSAGDARPAHVRNFLDCIKTRQKPVEHLELAHQVSTVAHLGNIAFRTREKIAWDAEKESIPNNPQADQLVTVQYRKPWTLPYSRRA